MNAREIFSHLVLGNVLIDDWNNKLYLNNEGNLIRYSEVSNTSHLMDNIRLTHKFKVYNVLESEEKYE
ncbi:MAG: hypothetical protein GTO02_13700 [Candidatus Dadabacteria bacterium]|nr:hypothetical protein [Candidatus Dadabacteria bacterium]